MGGECGGSSAFQLDRSLVWHLEEASLGDIKGEGTCLGAEKPEVRLGSTGARVLGWVPRAQQQA